MDFITSTYSFTHTFRRLNDGPFSQEDSNAIYRCIVEDNADELASIVSNYQNASIPLRTPTDYKYPAIISSSPYAIHIAAFMGAENCYDCLINMNVDEEVCDSCGRNVRHFAAAGGKMSILRKFSNFQVTKEPTPLRRYPYSYELDPMIYAIAFGNLDCIKYMWSKGIDFSSENSPYIHAACASGSIEIVKFIYDQCPNFFQIVVQFINDKNGLMYAASSGSVDIVKFLINLDVNLNEIASNGYTAIVIAARVGSLSCVQALIEAGASFNIRNRKYNCFVEAATQGHLDIVKYLIDQGVNININTSDNYDAITCAVEAGRVSVIKYLLMKGASFTPYKDTMAKTTPEVYELVKNEMGIKAVSYTHLTLPTTERV